MTHSGGDGTHPLFVPLESSWLPIQRISCPQHQVGLAGFLAGSSPSKIKRAAGETCQAVVKVEMLDNKGKSNVLRLEGQPPVPRWAQA